MATTSLDMRLQLAVDLALAAACGDAARLRAAEGAASAAGVTGAEIDACRRGSSFDLRLSRAIALALQPCEEHRRRARQAGLDEAICAEIERRAAIGSGRLG